MLAVEDEPEVLAAVVETLTDLDYRVLARTTPPRQCKCYVIRKDRSAVHRHRAAWGMNGVQWAAESSRIRPGIHLVLTSGYTNQARAGEHEVPADVSILIKPTDNMNWRSIENRELALGSGRETAFYNSRLFGSAELNVDMLLVTS